MLLLLPIETNPITMNRHLIYLFLLVLTGCAGQTIYVSPDGSDLAPGTRLRPVATLQRACRLSEELRASGCFDPSKEVSIEMQEGIYRISAPIELLPGYSGTEASPLVIRGRGEVVVSGARDLPGFVQEGDSVWKTELHGVLPCGNEIMQLFVNGKRAVRARTPNGGLCFRTGAAVETVFSGGTAVQKVKMPEDAIPELRRAVSTNSGRLKVEFYHCWDMTRRYVESFSEPDTAIIITGAPMPTYNSLSRESQFRLTDDPAFLDEPGEWFYDTAESVLHYIPRPGETPEEAEAVIPWTGRLLEIKGEEGRRVSHIRIENISFRYTGYQMPPEGNGPNQGAYLTDAAVMADYASDISLTGCEIAHTGCYGIWFREGCLDCSLTRCHLHDLGAGAVRIGSGIIPEDEEARLTRRITIDNNIIRDGGYTFPQGEGVLLMNASHCTVTHNEICDFYYTGVSVGWVWGYSYSPSHHNVISFNHIHHLGRGLLSDMGGVYTLGISPGTRVTDNVIHDICSFGYGGWGLYTDEGSTGILMENNLVYNCKCSGFHQHYGRENIIRNNIFLNGMKAQLEATRKEDHLSYTFTNNVISYRTGDMYGLNWEKTVADVRDNLYWCETGDVSFNGLTLDEWVCKTGKDSGSIIADPGFAGIDEGDFTMSNAAALEKIGFRPFDWTSAGVYGDTSFINLAHCQVPNTNSCLVLPGSGK